MEEVVINKDQLIVETQEIFKYLDKKIYDKIPEKIKNIINEYKGEYEFIYDPTKELNEQNILQATKDLIVGLYYRYAASDESKKIILQNIEKNEKEIIKKGEEFKEKYSVDNLFKNRKENSSIQDIPNSQNKQNESQALVVKKDSIFKKIVTKILNFFRKG